MVTIKRYTNRKLYNTETKKYISLEGLEALVRADQEIQVIDHLSGEDLTAFTLTQIIMECTKRRTRLFSNHFLMGIIRSQSDRLRSVSERWQTSTLNQQLIDEEIRLRIKTLVTSGELQEADADDIIHKLINWIPVTPDNNFIEIYVQKFFNLNQIPRKEDLRALFQKLDELDEKLADLNHVKAS